MTSRIEKPPSLQMHPRIVQYPSPSTSIAPPSVKSHRPSSSIFSQWKRTRSGSGGVSAVVDIHTTAETLPPHSELLCGVCLRDLDQDGNELECGHKFHSRCIEPVNDLKDGFDCRHKNVRYAENNTGETDLDLSLKN
jgi:hypothetical protein